MNELRIIKKKYGEVMMHLCRKIFPTILETDGLLLKLLEEHFAYNHNLGEDIINNDRVLEFKEYIYSLVSYKDNQVESDFDPEVLLEMAGYNLYECKTEEDIQSFRKYYAEGEEICTFNGGRLNKARVFFAVKKNVSDIKREDFPCAYRDDKYGTSVISIQFTKDGTNSLKITNRYNHHVINPDATFGNDLDNIIPGLTYAFAHKYGLVQTFEDTSFKMDGYILANDGKYYKYNYEINNIYYCPDNVIIDNFEVKKFNSDSFLIIDYFVLDLEKKKMYLYDKSIFDDFEEKVKGISDIEVYKHEDSKNVLIRFDSGDYLALLLDKFNNLKGLESNIDSVLGNDFLGYDETIESLILPNIEVVGDEFLYYNTNLKYYDFRNLRYAGKKFLYNNLAIKNVFLPSFEKADDEFMYFNKYIEKVYMPKLKETGKYFMYSAEQIEKFDLDLLERTSDYFLYNSNLQKEAYFPNLAEMGNYFMYSDDNVEILDAPNLREVGNFCFYKNLVLRNIISDNIESVGYGCNKEFERIDRRKVLRK